MVSAQQAVRRVGKVEVPLRIIDQVVRAVEAFAHEFIGEGDVAPVFLQTTDATIPVLAKDEAAFGVGGQAIGTRFAPAWNLPGITTGLEEDAEAFAFLPAINRVAGHIGEEQVTTPAGLRVILRNPHRPFAPVAAGDEDFDFRIRRQQAIRSRVQSQNFAHRRAWRQVVGKGRRLGADKRKTKAGGERFGQGVGRHGNMWFHGVAVCLRVMDSLTVRPERRFNFTKLMMIAPSR